MGESASRGNWVLDHVLAVLTLGSFAYIYWFATHFDLTALNQDIDPTQVPLGIVFAGTWSVIAALLFWLRMISDFVRHRPTRHAAAWGAFLIIAGHLAALFYFVSIWRPRHRPSPASN